MHLQSSLKLFDKGAITNDLMLNMMKHQALANDIYSQGSKALPAGWLHADKIRT